MGVQAIAADGGDEDEEEEEEEAKAASRFLDWVDSTFIPIPPPFICASRGKFKWRHTPTSLSFSNLKDAIHFLSLS